MFQIDISTFLSHWLRPLNPFEPFWTLTISSKSLDQFLLQAAMPINVLARHLWSPIWWPWTWPGLETSLRFFKQNRPLNPSTPGYTRKRPCFYENSSNFFRVVFSPASGKWKMGGVSASSPLSCRSTLQRTSSGSRQQPSSPAQGTGVGNRMEAVRMLQKGPPACGPPGKRNLKSQSKAHHPAFKEHQVWVSSWDEQAFHTNGASSAAKRLNLQCDACRRSPGVGPWKAALSESHSDSKLSECSTIAFLRSKTTHISYFCKKNITQTPCINYSKSKAFCKDPLPLCTQSGHEAHRRSSWQFYWDNWDFSKRETSYGKRQHFKKFKIGSPWKLVN